VHNQGVREVILPLNTCETTSGLMSPFLGFLLQETLAYWSESIRSCRDGWGLEPMTYESLREQDLFSPEKRRVKGESNHSLQLIDGCLWR